MAERMGFEPMKELILYTLSKRAPSATRPPLLTYIIKNKLTQIKCFIYYLKFFLKNHYILLFSLFLSSFHKNI